VLVRNCCLLWRSTVRHTLVVGRLHMRRDVAANVRASSIVYLCYLASRLSLRAA
jgi:hypothetical protein